MQSLLFLHPKTLVDSWPTPVDTLGEFIKAPALVYPLLAALVEDLPYDVEIFDGYVTRESFHDYKLRLARADVVCITVATPLKALNTELTIHLLRRLNPRAHVVLGGNHATYFAEEWIKRGADFVVVRDGEHAFRALAERLAAGATDFSDVPNLVYAGKDGEPIRTAGRAVTGDLDATPIPRWEIFDFRPFHSGIGFRGPTACIEASRGCPYRCDFCNINRHWDYRQRYKSVDRVIEEMERLHRLGVRQFIFADDNFAQDISHTTALLERMIRRDFDFRFGGFLRTSTVQENPELPALAARAGMRLVLMGLESLDTAWLKAHRKGLRTNDARAFYAEAYRLLQRAGIAVLGLFINPVRNPVTPSGQGADGTVCDFHFSADLVAQRGSALFDVLERQGRVVKDMFYHDWNLPSVREVDTTTASRKGFRYWAGSLQGTSLRHMIGSSPMTRRFWRSNAGVLAERILMSHPSDIQRYRWAMDTSLTPAERQDRIVASVLNERFVERLAQARFWRGPLSIRTGF